MSIKILRSQLQEDMIFTISEDTLIATFSSNSERVCLWCEGKDIKWEKLERFFDAKDLKIVAGKRMLEKVNKLSIDFFQTVSTKKVLDTGTKVVYHSASHKLRVTKQKHKSVLVVDDSKTIQKLLGKVVLETDGLSLLGVASSAQEALDFVKKQTPDVITLDIHMPGMDGVEFLKSHLQEINSSVVMISSVTMEEGPLVVDALSSGASAYLEKPTFKSFDDAKIAIADTLLNVSKRKKKIISKRTSKKFLSQEGLVLIGSSTGGTKALEDVLIRLPDEIPPIVIVQHIPAVFSAALADRLNTLVSFNVCEAKNGNFIEPNTVYIAPGGKHLKLLKRGAETRIELNEEELVNRFRPSVDYTFNSYTNAYKSFFDQSVIGVILTGMGKDGAKGLLNLKNAGARTITQDEASSVVYGMPKAAFEIGASDNEESLENIADSIVDLHNRLSMREAS